MRGNQETVGDRLLCCRGSIPPAWRKTQQDACLLTALGSRFVGATRSLRLDDRDHLNGPA